MMQPHTHEKKEKGNDERKCIMSMNSYEDGGLFVQCSWSNDTRISWDATGWGLLNEPSPFECFLPTHWYSICIWISITYFVFSLIYEFTLQQLCNSTQSDLETVFNAVHRTLFNHRNATAMSHLNFLKHSWVANYDLPQSTMGTTVTLHNRGGLFFSYVSCPLPYSTEWKAGISNGREHNTCIYYPEALNNDPKLH